MSSWELQKSIYAALTGNTTLIALANIYDGAPVDATLPYVDLGEADANDWSTKTETGTDHDLTMHVWSGYRGKKQVFNILDQIKTTLHQSSLTVTGYSLVFLRYENSRVFQDINGQTWHGVIEFRALVQ